jgi:hypothetical protein
MCQKLLIFAPQALEYRINWDIYTLYADATGMLDIIMLFMT